MKSVARGMIGVLVVVAMFVTACGRSGDGAEDASDEAPQGDGGSGDGGGRLADGEFGELGVVCQDGQSSGTPDQIGVSDTEIRVGTVTDKGSDARPGLTQEMYDTAVAFAEWCNEHGGINGRQLVVDDLDARLTEYPQRIEEACQNDFALVGGGAVFDNADNGQRVDCGLVNIPSYVVTPEARVADQQVQPIPIPVHQFPAQVFRRVQELHPGVSRFGVLWVDVPGTATVHDQTVEVVETLGYEVVWDQTYQALNETGWSTFVQNMREADVQVLEFVSEPDYLVSLLAAMETEDWYPEVITLEPNMYDDRLLEEAASSANTDIYLRNVFPLFDMDGEVPAIADYLELMETYNPEGRYPAMLGAQALSSFLLFATAAAECGDDLTRDCVLEAARGREGWTAGGLHAPTAPGNLEAPDCGLLMTFGPDGYAYDEEATDPTDGLFNCDEENQQELTRDYGVDPPDG
jgi:ABC-type branched-subunit amino acid transport system substrate-binding protein